MRGILQDEIVDTAYLFAQLFICMVFPPLIYGLIMFRDEEELAAKKAIKKRKKNKHRVRYRYQLTRMCIGISPVHLEHSNILYLSRSKSWSSH